MLLTGQHLQVLDALMTHEATGQSALRATEAEDEANVYRVLDLEGLTRQEVGRGYILTPEGHEASQLLGKMRAHKLLLPADQIKPSWRFLGSEVLAALAAAERSGGHVGPLADELLRERGFAQITRDPDRKIRILRLTTYGTAWLDFARSHRPRLEITGDLANSIHHMPPAYVDPHTLALPAGHSAQLEAMRLVIWSVPDRTVFTFTALGQSVYDALRMGGYPVAGVVLDDAILTLLATLAEQGASALGQDQLALVQMLGYVDADGGLIPGGEAALRVRRLRDAPAARRPATIVISRYEAELLEAIQHLSEEQSHVPQPATKAVLHKVLVDSLQRRYEAFVGKYGRTIEEIPARKRQAQEMVADLRDRDRGFGRMDVLDETLVHLESFELLRGERDGQETVYRLTPHGQQVVKEQGESPHDISGTAVKAITITTMAGHFYAPASRWIESARAEELIGPGGITKAGRFYAWLAEHVRRLPALTRSEAQMLRNLPDTEPVVVEQQNHGASHADTEHDGEQEHTLDRLEARGLIERLVDGQIVHTDTGRLLEQAVAGALELAYPITPSIVRLLLAVRQVGESLHVKEEKVRILPHQWVEVERLTGLAPDEFRETVHLARLGKYLGEANVTEAGRTVLEIMDVGNRGV